MTISGKTQLYAVIGDPIEHTLSPAIQNAAFQALNIDALFVAFKVATTQVEHAIQGMRSLGIRGLNVTMPNKNTVIPYLDEIDETAKLLDSVNTIQNENGKLRGFSTDGAGIHRALEENKVNLSEKKLVLLGAGGAARAIALALAREAKELVILSRTPEKNNELAEILTKKFQTKVTTATLSQTNITQNLNDADVLINATSAGMHPNEKQTLVEPAWFKPNLTVMDIIYNPLETRLTKDAKAAGARVISGVEMLIHQGAASFEIWTGKAAPIEVMRKAALNQLKTQAKKHDD
ncbi:MAG TPA: shikimate dehydrogenase [Candidatus Nanoarchaeia archaeon]|nr:shikimate dehydrogenase [Candidatus Nanoarchaeia archaeon]